MSTPKMIEMKLDEDGNDSENDNNNNNDNDSIIGKKRRSELIAEQIETENKQELALNAKCELYKGELEFWQFKAINKLMFHTDTDREMNARIIAEIHAKYGEPQCTYNNTRFPEKYELKSENKKELSEKEKALKGYSLVTTPIISLDDDDRPKGPMFHINKVPYRDELNDKLNKTKSQKLRKKKQDRLRNTTPGYGYNSSNTKVYTTDPLYNTKTIITPSGNHIIHTPLVGMTRNSKDKHHKSMMLKRNKHRIRRIEDLSPAARKLMQSNLRGKNENILSTPISGLRQSYSLTPNVNNNKRKRKLANYRKNKSNDNIETPSMINTNECTPTANSKRRRLDHDSSFKKPVRAISHKKRKT